MLEEQGAELAMASLREISIHYRLLIFIKVAAMVSLLCCQSELRVSRERQCHNICFDCEPHSKDAILSRLSIAINCQSFYFVDFANIFMYTTIAFFVSCCLGNVKEIDEYLSSAIISHFSHSLNLFQK